MSNAEPLLGRRGVANRLRVAMVALGLVTGIGCHESRDHVLRGNGSGLGGTLVIGALCPQDMETCVAGATCVGGTCREIVCTPNQQSPCWEGEVGQRGVGLCSDGTRRCDPTGTYWLEGCQGQRLPAAAEACATAGDDDCDGVANPSDRCGTGVYAFSVAPGCGAWCYYDEAHNQTLVGSPFKAGPLGTFAAGQLVDGKRGGNAWAQDHGFGPAHEWVGWIQGEPTITLRMPRAREVQRITVGLSNADQGGVTQPSVIAVETRLGDEEWSAPTLFALGDGSQPLIPIGERDDLPLHLEPKVVSELRLTFTRTGWLMIDEIEVD